MGFLERIRAVLSGDTSAKLTEFPSEYQLVEVPRLEVHTANLSPDTDELMVIITTSPAALEVLRGAGEPVRIVAKQARPVTFVPVREKSVPVLDPNLGWIIPVTEATARELANIPEGPGEHELSSLHLGLILR